MGGLKPPGLLEDGLARLALASSARSLRFSASKSSNSAGVSAPDCLGLRPQTRRDLLLAPRSTAMRGDRAARRGRRIGLGVQHEFDETMLELCGVFDEQVGCPFPISYPPLHPGRPRTTRKSTPPEKPSKVFNRSLRKTQADSPGERTGPAQEDFRAHLPHAPSSCGGRCGGRRRHDPRCFPGRVGARCGNRR